MSGYIAIVIDDGRKTDVTVGLQKQLDRGMTPKGTSYIVGSYIGSSDSWMDVSDCKTLLDNGWDLQDHTYTHGVYDDAFWTKTGNEIREELQLMNDFFTETLGTAKPKHWSIPGGTLTRKILDVVGRERETIMVGGSKFITPYSNALMFPSFDISPTYNQTKTSALSNRSATIYKVIDDCVTNNYACALFCHELEEQSEIDAYTDVLDYGLKSGAQFVTVSELYDIFKPRKVYIPVR